MEGISRQFLLLVLLCIFPLLAYAAPLQQAIQDFEQENFEEALQVLETLRADEASAELSYYLGMTHHAMGNTQQAIPHLEEAARLGMKKDMLFRSLAEAFLATEDYNAALSWLQVGEEAGFTDGEMAYLKGVTLARQKSYPAALQALDLAEKRAPEISGKIDYLRAQIFVAENDFEQAAQVLQKVINAAPESTMAESAREYNRQYKQLAKEHSDWRGAVQLGYMYDSNSIAEPEQTIPGAILPDAEDHALNGRFRVEYAPRISGKVMFSSRYDVNAILYDENSISDQIIQNIAISPGYRLTDATLTVPFSFTHQTRDGDKYQQSFALTPTLNLNLDSQQVLQVGVGYTLRDTLFDYANAATEALESREGDIYMAQLGYYYLFARNRGMANARYEYTDERTDGRHWESQGHRIGLSALLPISEKLSMDLFAGVYFQDFDNVNSFFNEQRSDTTKNFAVGATWEMNNNTRLYARYQNTRADSNIFIYEYRRNLAMLGVEYGF